MNVSCFQFQLHSQKSNPRFVSLHKAFKFLVNTEKKLVQWSEGSQQTPHQFGLYLRPNVNLHSILKSFSSGNKLFPLVLNQRW